MTYKKLYVIAGCNGAGKTTGFGFSDANKTIHASFLVYTGQHQYSPQIVLKQIF
jgi:hypothetical protein